MFPSTPITSSISIKFNIWFPLDKVRYKGYWYGRQHIPESNEIFSSFLCKNLIIDLWNLVSCVFISTSYNNSLFPLFFYYI